MDVVLYARSQKPPVLFDKTDQNRFHRWFELQFHGNLERNRSCLAHAFRPHWLIYPSHYPAPNTRLGTASKQPFVKLQKPLLLYRTHLPKNKLLPDSLRYSLQIILVFLCIESPSRFPLLEWLACPSRKIDAESWENQHDSRKDANSTCAHRKKDHLFWQKPAASVRAVPSRSPTKYCHHDNMEKPNLVPSIEVQPLIEWLHDRVMWHGHTLLSLLCSLRIFRPSFLRSPSSEKLSKAFLLKL